MNSDFWNTAFSGAIGRLRSNVAALESEVEHQQLVNEDLSDDIEEMRDLISRLRKQNSKLRLHLNTIIILLVTKGIITVEEIKDHLDDN
jgi:predicted RNase H-like nuclease (RuvC/YqgF family)